MGGATYLDELYHYGILGMKWGVRRFQNKDGSYTAAGRKRYDKGDATKQKVSHRDKLVSKYLEKGMSQKEAEQAADKRIDFEKKVAIGAGVAVGALAVYGVYRYSTNANTLNPKVNLDSQLKRKTFESMDFDTQINDDLRIINREGTAGHSFLRGRKVNCTSCSMAYEMRRRGYDVVAGRTKEGRSNETVERFFKNAHFQPLYNNRPSDIDLENPTWDDIYKLTHAPKPSQRDIDSTVNTLLSQGEGARGIIHGGYFCGGAHSIAWEVHNGTVHFVDGQIGRQYKDANEAIGLMTCVDFLRTDNLELSNSAAETVMNNTASSLLTELPSNYAIGVGAATAYGVANVADSISRTRNSINSTSRNANNTQRRNRRR